MDPYESAMVEFVQIWRPYGGADDQILPEFGMTADVFYRRVLDILERPRLRSLELAVGERHDLQEFCYQKLRQCGHSVMVPPQRLRFLRYT